MLRHIDDLDGLAGGLGLFGGTFLALPAHFVGVPTDVAHKLKTLVGDMLGDRRDEVAGGKDLEVAVDLRVHAGTIDDAAVGVGTAVRRQAEVCIVWFVELHLLQGEGVSHDVLGKPLEILSFRGQHPPTTIHVESGMHPPSRQAPIWPPHNLASIAASPYRLHP